MFGEKVDLSRRMSGPKKEEAEGGWGKFYNKEISGCESTPYLIKGMRSRSARWEEFWFHTSNVRNP